MQIDAKNEEINLVEIWLRRDPVRWVSGILAGFFAGVVAIAVGAVISIIGGHEIFYPVKIAAAILLGPSATEIGLGGIQILAIGLGFGLIEAVCGFLGLLYGHFAATNDRRSLLAVGLVWGLFSWIFIGCLFSQSFRPVLWIAIPKSALFPVMLAFGFSLASVSNFDFMVRGRRH